MCSRFLTVDKVCSYERQWITANPDPATGIRTASCSELHNEHETHARPAGRSRLRREIHIMTVTLIGVGGLRSRLIMHEGSWRIETKEMKSVCSANNLMNMSFGPGSVADAIGARCTNYVIAIEIRRAQRAITKVPTFGNRHLVSPS